MRIRLKRPSNILTYNIKSVIKNAANLYNAECANSPINKSTIKFYVMFACLPFILAFSVVGGIVLGSVLFVVHKLISVLFGSRVSAGDEELKAEDMIDILWCNMLDIESNAISLNILLSSDQDNDWGVCVVTDSVLAKQVESSRDSYYKAASGDCIKCINGVVSAMLVGGMMVVSLSLVRSAMDLCDDIERTGGKLTNAISKFRNVVSDGHGENIPKIASVLFDIAAEDVVIDSKVIAKGGINSKDDESECRISSDNIDNADVLEGEGGDVWCASQDAERSSNNKSNSADCELIDCKKDDDVLFEVDSGRGIGAGDGASDCNKKCSSAECDNPTTLEYDNPTTFPFECSQSAGGLYDNNTYEKYAAQNAM